MDIAFQFLLDNCKILICNQFFSACFIIESLVSNENVNRIFMIDICENNDLGIVISNTFCFQLVAFQRLIDISRHTSIIWLDLFFFRLVYRLNWRNAFCHSFRNFRWKIYHKLTGFDLPKNDILYRSRYFIHKAFTS